MNSGYRRIANADSMLGFERVGAILVIARAVDIGQGLE